MIKTWDFREDLKVIVLHHPDEVNNSKEEDNKDKKEVKDDEEEDNNKNDDNNFSALGFHRLLEFLQGIVFHPTLMMITRREATRTQARTRRTKSVARNQQGESYKK